jgi:hypothetical protein
MIKVIDNFLDNTEFLKIKNLFFSGDLNWYYLDFKVFKNDKNFQFIHNFYDNFTINSDYYNIIIPIINKLKCKSLIRIRANLTTVNKKIKKYDFHNDYNFDCKTSIFYLNTNNGKTIFENGKKIDSVENRMVIFPSHIKHTGTTHTDENIRIVLNINYF